jgi:CDP-diacylglycerol--serine O-phosphatidyltransferase
MALLFWLDLTGQQPGTQFWGGQYKLLGRDFHPFSVLFAISGSLMISTIKVPKP